MHSRRLRSLLAFLALLGGAPAVFAESAPLPECSMKAWVRAPDLSPDTIVQGDVRLKISDGCSAVETALLGLRFKERAFMKAIRSREEAQKILLDQQKSPWSPSTLGSQREIMLVDSNIWIIREEERVVFDTTQNLHAGIGELACHDITQDFFILVPSTNFPPAFDHRRYVFPMNRIELVNVDSIYEYYVRLSFTNGTTKDIPAGFTAFRPQYDQLAYPPRHSPEIIALESSAEFYKSQTKTSSAANYTVEVHSPSGLVFFEGSEDHVITIVITRTGPARKFTRPLTVWGCVKPTSSASWAVQHGVAESQFTREVLRDDLGPHDFQSWLSCVGSPTTGISLMMPNPTLDQLHSKEIVTSSATVTIPIQISRRQVPNFETYYQSFTNVLCVKLRVPRKQDERIDPDDPDAEVIVDQLPWFEDDEADWVPWMKTTPSRVSLWVTHDYSGETPAVVRPAADAQLPPHCLRSSKEISGQQVMTSESDCSQASLVHYLSDGARGPIFVGGSLVQELRFKEPAEQATLAPFLEPVVSSFAQGKEPIRRYFPYAEGGRPPPIYVGATWRKRVASRDQDRAIITP